jgi:hypothetical protein
MVFYYLSRRVGWILAVVFFFLAIGMFMAPDTTGPVVGAMVTIGDRAIGDILETLKHVLS